MDYRPLEEIKENQSSHEVHKSVEGFELEEDDLNDLDNGNGFEYKAYTYSDADRSMRTITHKATDNEKLALKSSPFHAALNIYRASLGTAFLAVPYLANLVGWKIFLLSIVMAVATTLYGTHMLLAVADSLGYYGSSYDKMLAFVFKKRWPMHVVKVVIVISEMLGAIGNNLFIIDMLVYVFCEQGFFSQFCKPRLVYVLTSFILSAPIYLIINLKYFSYVSLISTLVASIILLMLALQSTEHLFSTENLEPSKKPQIYKFFIAFSVIFRTVQSILLVMPIRSSMANPNLFKTLHRNVTFLAALGFMVSYLLTIAAYGSIIKPIVILSFPKEYTIFFVLAILYGLATFLSYPIALFPIYTALLESSMTKKYILSAQDEKTKQNRTTVVMYIIRLICIVTVYAGVATNPNFIPFLGFLSASFTTTLAFFIPLIMYDAYFSAKGQLSTPLRIFNWILCAVMMIISLVAIRDSLLNIYKKNSK